ncbi:MAG: glycosyltransferase [Bacteroidales bacterium]|jgi:glycosyltransferase involved in cell wall biosynthesis
MEKNNPLISVIIPVYNEEQYLSEALDSVRQQSYSPVEIIVIDDDSVDNSATIAKSYQTVKYFFQSKSGVSVALNKGLGIASGDFFAFLDADDIWEERKLSLQMEALRKDPSLDAVFGHHRQFISRDVSRTIEDWRILPAPFKGAMLIRRESFFRVGLFDISLTLGDFIDWYKRAMEADLKFLMLPDIVMRRRIHDDNSSVRNRHAKKDYVKIMKAALDRKRKKEAEQQQNSTNPETGK